MLFKKDFSINTSFFNTLWLVLPPEKSHKSWKSTLVCKRGLFSKHQIGTPYWSPIQLVTPLTKLFNLPEIDFPSSFFPFYLATLEPQISLLQTECCCICRGVRNINGESFASMPLALPSFHKIDTLGSYTAILTENVTERVLQTPYFLIMFLLHE